MNKSDVPLEQTQYNSARKFEKQKGAGIQGSEPITVIFNKIFKGL